jgi:hypothetical protein
MTDLSIEPATERCAPEPGPAFGLIDRDERWPADPPSPRGVRLTRLIGLAALTAPQVLEVGAGLLAEVARRSESNTDALSGGQIMTDQFVIDTDGRVMLGPASHDERNGRSSSTVVSTVTAVEAMLMDLASAGRAPRADPATDQLLAELDRAMALLPVAGVSEVAQMVERGCAAIDRTVVRAELAALVSAIVESAGSAKGNEPTGGPPPGVLGINHGWRSTSGGTRTTGRRIGAWLLSVVVLAAVVLLEVAFLRDEIVADVGLLLDAGRSGSAPSAAPEADGLPVPPLAPAAAGPVTAVDVRILEPCAPGAPCTVRVLVSLVPGPDPQVVTWSYRVVDPCTGTTDTAPGGSVTVPPGAGRAEAVGIVALPPTTAVAVVATTDRPAVAAASPVLVGSCEPDPQTR